MKEVKKDMGIVKGYMKKGGAPGNWATTKNVKANDTVTIGEVWLDDQSFENKTYVCINGKYDPTGDDMKVRLGQQNLARIIEHSAMTKPLGLDRN